MVVVQVAGIHRLEGERLRVDPKHRLRVVGEVQVIDVGTLVDAVAAVVADPIFRQPAQRGVDAFDALLDLSLSLGGCQIAETPERGAECGIVDLENETGIDCGGVCPACMVVPTTLSIVTAKGNACLSCAQTFCLDNLTGVLDCEGVAGNAAAGTPAAGVSKTKLCTNLKIRQSLGRTGSCFDNSVAEAFFSTLEWEVLRRHHFTTKDQAREVIATWAEEFYNARRRHSTIGMTSPVVFEQSLTLQAQAA